MTTASNTTCVNSTSPRFNRYLCIVLLVAEVNNLIAILRFQDTVNARTKVFAAESLDDTRFAPGDYKYLDDEGLEQPLKSFGEKTEK